MTVTIGINRGCFQNGISLYIKGNDWVSQNDWYWVVTNYYFLKYWELQKPGKLATYCVPLVRQ